MDIEIEEKFKNLESKIANLTIELESLKNSLHQNGLQHETDSVDLGNKIRVPANILDKVIE